MDLLNSVRSGERSPIACLPLELDGTGEIVLESADYFTTRAGGDTAFRARTSGLYLRADAPDVTILDGRDAAARAALIAERMEDWRSLLGA